MAATLIKSVMLKITADDGDTESKLAKISAQADELARKHPDLTPRINTAAASAKLKVLKAELNDTSKQADQAGGRMSALGSAVNLFATGGISGGIAEMGTFGKALAVFNIASGLAEPLVAGLTVAAGGLAAGFLSAGAGLGVFGEVAKGVWGNVQANITAYSKASIAIANGDTGKKLIADNKALAASVAGLTGQQKNLVYAASNADVQWHNFTTNATAGVNSVLVPALGLVPKALALITPFLAPVEKALSGIVSGVSKGLDSGGLKSFVSTLASNAGPAITKVATAIKNVAVGIGGILKAFMPVSQGMMSGLDKITGEFAKWGSTLTSHSGFQNLMAMFKNETPLAVNALHSLGGIIKTVVSQMTGMDTFSNSKMLLQLAAPVLAFANALLKAHPQLVWLVLYLKLGADGAGKLKVAFAGLAGGITGIKDATKNVGNLRAGLKDSEAAASDATGAWGTFGGKISGLGTGIKTAVTGIKDWAIWSKIAGAATKVWTGIQAAFDVVMDANPITIIVIAVIALIAVIVLLAVKFKPVRDFFKQAWHDIVQWTVDAWHGIESAFDAIVKAVSTAVSAVINFVKAHWPLIVGIFLGPIALVVALIIQHWNQIRSETVKLIGDVVGFFEKLPGRIMSAISALPGMMFRAGVNVINSLISGIKSMFGAVGSVVGGLASKVAGFFGLSRAKEGPLSGGGAPEIRGAHFAEAFAQGMSGRSQRISTAAAGIAQAASMVTGGGGLAAALGGGATMHIDTSNSDPIVRALVTALQEHIRVTFGGDVQKALGRGKRS